MSVATRIRASIAGAALAVVATLAFALPAQAHDELVASTPAAGETLTAAPDAISLEFSGEVLPDGLAATVTSADGSGEDWADGAPTADGMIVTVPVKEAMPGGSYVAVVRVVSSDGHPVEAEVPFTVDLAGPTSSPTQAPVTTESATPTPQSSTEAAPAESGPLSPHVMLVVAGLAVVALAIVVVVLMVGRKGPKA